MNRIPVIALFLAVWAATFLSTQLAAFRSITTVPLQLVPALVVYAALTHSLAVTTSLAFTGALLTDAVSAGPLGTGILPLLGVATAIHLRRHLILRDQPYAQFWIGTLAGFLVPALTLPMAQHTGPAPAIDLVIAAKLALLGLINGAACPAIFKLFDRIREAFEYPALPPTSFRSDRVILRGKH